MTRQTIDTTTGGGDTAKSGGDKINANFAELYTRMIEAEARLSAIEGGTSTPTPTPTPTPSPTLSLSSAVTLPEGNSGTTLFPWTLTLSRDGSTEAYVYSWAVTPNASSSSPANAADFGGTFPSGSGTFAAGETSKPINVLATGDTAVEPSDSFILTVTSTGLGTVTSIGTISNDDVASGTITIDPIVQRSGQIYTFTARRTTNLANAESRTITVAGSTAYPPGAVAADFPGNTFPTAVANFAANAATAPFTITAPAAVQPE